MLAGATRYGFGLGRCHSTLRPRRVAAPARTRRRRWLPPAVQSRRHPLRALAPGVSSISPLGPLVGRLVLWGAQFFSCGALHAAAGCAASAGSCPVTQMWPGCVILNSAVLDKTNLLLAKTCCGGIQPNTMRWDFFGNFRARFLKFPKFLAKIVGNSIYSMIRGMYNAFCTR